MFRITVISLVLALAGCAAKSGIAPASETPTTATAPAESTGDVKTVASTDGSFNGEIVGTVKPGSKFSKLKIGMSMEQVHKLIKAPDDMYGHETGKRWIPFYFGNDVQRLQTYYAGEGCLTYTGGNAFGEGGIQLIRIAVSSSKKCME